MTEDFFRVQMGLDPSPEEQEFLDIRKAQTKRLRRFIQDHGLPKEFVSPSQETIGDN